MLHRGTARVILEEYRIYPNQDGFYLHSSGTFDFSGYSSDKNYVKIPFKSGGLNSEIKAQLSEKFELERTESLNGTELSEFTTKTVALTSRQILFVSQFQTPENYISQILLGAFAVLTVGIGGGIYLVANLGAGPRDGLMIGLQQKTNLPIALVRAALEITVMSIGWYLGGTVGIGTLLFAFGIGPCVALGLFLVNKLFN